MIATNICVFGDSVSKGVVFDIVKQKYSVLKDSFVNLSCSALKITLKNYSKFGCTVTKGAELIKKHIEEIKASDYTVLEFGGNDSDYDWASIAKDPKGEYLPKTPMDSFIKSYSSIIESVIEIGGKPVLLNLPPLDAQRFFNWVSKGLDKELLLEWLGGRVDYIYRWHESYSIQIAKLAQKYSVPMMDIRSAFLNRTDYSELLCEDGMHPNEDGHKLIFQQIQLFVNNYSNSIKGILELL